MRKLIHNITLVTTLVLIGLQTCGCGGDDSETSIIETSIIETNIFDTVKPLVDTAPIDNRIIQPNVMSLPPQTKPITTEVSIQEPIVTKDMWSENVLLGANPNEFYVATNGQKSNLGTNESPWDLLSVANGEHIIPGNSIVWLKPGEYKHPDTVQSLWKYFDFTLSGQVNAPIHIRPLPPQNIASTERVIIDGGIRVHGSWLWIWELEQTALEDWRPWDYYFDINTYEILEYEPDRLFTEGLYDIAGNIAHGVGDSNGKLSNRRDAMHVLDGNNSKFINMTLHGLNQGLGFWALPKNSEFYGNLVYNNGYIDQDRAHGPGLYIQNASETVRFANDNIVAGNFSNPMQMRSTDPSHLGPLTMIGNIFFAPRIEADGRNYLHVGEVNTPDVLFENNIAHAINVIFPYGGTPVGWVSPDNQQCDNNFFYRTYILSGQTCVQSTTNEESLSPLDESLTKAIIRPNKYDPRRANLAILNGERKSDISLSLGNFAKEGDIIVVKNSLDPYGEPIAYGKYNGEYFNIHWPTSKWQIEAEKYVQDTTTVDKEFWAFVIIRLRQ